MGKQNGAWSLRDAAGSCCLGLQLTTSGRRVQCDSVTACHQHQLTGYSYRLAAKRYLIGNKGNKFLEFPVFPLRQIREIAYVDLGKVTQCFAQDG